MQGNGVIRHATDTASVAYKTSIIPARTREAKNIRGEPRKTRSAGESRKVASQGGSCSRWLARHHQSSGTEASITTEAFLITKILTKIKNTPKLKMTYQFALRTRHVTAT